MNTALVEEVPAKSARSIMAGKALVVWSWLVTVVRLQVQQIALQAPASSRQPRVPSGTLWLRSAPKKQKFTWTSMQVSRYSGSLRVIHLSGFGRLLFDRQSAWSL